MSRYEIHEIIKLYQLDENFVRVCIDNQWIIPADVEGGVLDQEDLSRLLLINDLRFSMDINEEAIPVIMQLLDQIYWLKKQLS
ncbi:chaperone modulator CbpM [Candidatus Magnetaquicoccus inordinatus]|uniref:chaperone modulator CbpM n=1 Tax=Candidatus Magnetaquicoccus inordinatus TaxID=2496818 RepID=UPI00102B81D2|nr:chaperone modulator CbpM [Candidatus Magnetaquicoccus inordinatus]